MDISTKIRFSLLHKLVTYLMSGLGLFALSLGTELSPIAIGLITVGYFASYFAEGALLSRPWYGSGWTAAVVLFLAIQLSRALAGGMTLAIAIEYAAFLQISRLFNRRTGADYQQVAVLAFLHLIGATVLSTSLTYAVVFFSFVIVTPWMLALSNLRRQIEVHFAAAGHTDKQTEQGIARVLASKRVVGPGYLLGTAALSVPLFVGTLLIFMVAPRVGQGFFNFQRDPAHKMAGFGAQLELGGLGTIAKDPTVVIRITPLQKWPPRSADTLFRLRGTSFDHYDGRRWTRTLAAPSSLKQSAYYAIARWPDFENDGRLRIALERFEEKVLFLPEGAVALEIEARAQEQSWSSLRLVRSAGLDIRYLGDDGLGITYTAYIDPYLQSVYPANSDDSLGSKSDALAPYLQLPSGHERILALARDLSAGAHGEREKIERLVGYLRDSGRFQYSLEQPRVSPSAPLEGFLLEERKGHCEYFSSALAIMLRAVGIASRNVTGFLGGRYNPYGEYYAVSQGEAHSWVEAFVPGQGWITLDPTPAASEPWSAAGSVWSDMYALVDALRTRWSSGVVAYDFHTQLRLLRQMESWVNRFSYKIGWYSLKDTSAKREIGNFKTLTLTWIAGLLALVVATGAAIGWRLQVGKRSLTKRVSQTVGLYRELERALTSRGFPRPDHATPCEHAKSLCESGFPQLAEVREVTDRYMQARYGDRPLSAGEMKLLRAKIDAVRSGRTTGPKMVLGR
jgi:transglutaminase-like putative cysteine protease